MEKEEKEISWKTLLFFLIFAGLDLAIVFGVTYVALLWAMQTGSALLTWTTFAVVPITVQVAIIAVLFS